METGFSYWHLGDPDTTIYSRSVLLDNTPISFFFSFFAFFYIVALGDDDGLITCVL